MGAQTFYNRVTGKTAKKAFDKLVEDALWTHGHDGYSGTIAEKHGFTEFKRPKGIHESTVIHILNKISNANSSEITTLEKAYPKWPIKQMVITFDDKWGPAVCVEVKPHKYVFCGWVSS